MDLLGFDHEQLTYRTAGRDFRLTQATGRCPQGGMPVKGIIARIKQSNRVSWFADRIKSGGPVC